MTTRDFDGDTPEKHGHITMSGVEEDQDSRAAAVSTGPTKVAELHMDNKEEEAGDGVSLSKKSGEKKRKAEDDDDDSDASSGASDKKPKAAPSPTAKKAKNFAERLMRYLQAGGGDDAMWWVGDGKAIAIHTKNIRKGDLLSRQFKVKDYPVFIRNCNRWGFRRTVQFPVPQGVITYQCSLFQRDEPHLVHHMRMDSDVQDVFINHTKTKGDEPFDPKRLRKEARARARLGQLHDPRLPPPGFGDLQGVGLGLHGVLGANSMGAPAPFIQRNLHEFNALHSLQRDDALQLIQQNNLSSLFGTTAATASHHTAIEDPPGLNAAPPDTDTSGSLSASAPNTSGVRRLLGVLDSARGSHQQLASPQSVGQKKAKMEAILDQILSLSDDYLNHPRQPGDEPIRMALNLLKIQGKKLQEEQDKKTSLNDQLSTFLETISGSGSQVAPAGMHNVSLLSQALQTAGSAEIPPSRQQQNTLGGGGSDVQRDLLAQIMAVRGQNLQAQQRSAQQDADDSNNGHGLTQENLARYLAELQRQRGA